MKVSAFGVATLLASVVSARSIFSPSEITILDESLKVPGDNPLEHCAVPTNDLLELKKVDLSPNPPKPGQTLKIHATGTVKEDIEEGAKVHLIVKYGLIRLISMDVDLCEKVDEVDLKCPVKKGSELDLTKEVEIPNEVPPGKYSVEANVTTKDAALITCLKATVAMSRSANLFDFKENL